MDVCPVGALTLREFRFRKRAWKLRSTPSICAGCSIGCNIWIDHHEPKIAEGDVLGEEAVGADDDVDGALGERRDTPSVPALIKLAADGTVIYSTYLGGRNDDVAVAIGDHAGQAVGLAVHQAMERARIQPLAQRERHLHPSLPAEAPDHGSSACARSGAAVRSGAVEPAGAVAPE